MSTKLSELTEALATYVEVSRSLRQALDAYDGHSPDYVFGHAIDGRAEAERNLGAAFTAFIHDVLVVGTVDRTAPLKLLVLLGEAHQYESSQIRTLTEETRTLIPAGESQ